MSSLKLNGIITYLDLLQRTIELAVINGRMLHICPSNRWHTESASGCKFPQWNVLSSDDDECGSFDLSIATIYSIISVYLSTSKNLSSSRFIEAILHMSSCIY